MYGKIFDSIYDGTLADDWRALVTFQQMIVLCDSDGVVDMTPSAISRRTGIPIEHIKAGIEVLENPDPYTRTEGEEGRRIVRIDEHRPWGWVIVNHGKYKALQDYETVKEQTRERVRRHREKKKGVTDGNGCNGDVTDGNDQKRHTDTDTDTRKDMSDSGKPESCPHEEIIKLYHEKLPELQSVVVSRWKGSKREKTLQARWREDPKHRDMRFWDWFFSTVRTNPHWMGENGSGWRADLGWLLERRNFDKVIERGVSRN